MSLVNQMLRDLEKRREDSSQIGDSHSESIVESIDENAQKKRIIMIALALCLIMALGGVTWILANQKSTSAHPVVQLDQLSLSDAIPLEKHSELVSAISELEPPSAIGLPSKTVSLRPENTAHQKSLWTETTPSESNENVPTVGNVQNDQDIASGGASLVNLPETANKVERAQQAPEASTIAGVEKAEKSLLHESAMVASKDSPQLVKQKRVDPIRLDIETAESAQKLLAKGDWSEAKIRLAEFIDTHDTHVRSLETLVSIELASNHLDDAADLLESVPHQINSPRLRMLKARYLAHQQKGNEAAQLLANELPDMADYADYFELIGALYQQNGQVQKAAAVYTQLVAYDPKQANWWVGQAVALDSMGRLDNARLGYRQALQLDGLDPKLAQYARSRMRALN